MNLIKKITIFDNIKDLEKELLEDYYLHVNDSKGDYITQVNKLIDSLKNIKYNEYVFLAEKKVDLFIFKKFEDGRIGVYDIFEYIPSDN